MSLQALTHVSGMPGLSLGELVLRLGLGAACGGAIGIERELRGRHAGFRTHMLVALASALFTLLSAHAFPSAISDPTRIAAQIVSGIGFVGAASVVRQRFGVHGLTTAATVWLAAALGMAAGAGCGLAAGVATAFAVVSLWPLRLVAHFALQPRSPRIVVSLEDGASVAGVMLALERLGVRIDRFEHDESDLRTVTLRPREVPEELRPERVAATLSRLPAVRGAQVLGGRGRRSGRLPVLR